MGGEWIERNRSKSAWNEGSVKILKPYILYFYIAKYRYK